MRTLPPTVRRPPAVPVDRIRSTGNLIELAEMLVPASV